MPYLRDRALCLTCGGPAAICAASDRCVALDDPRLAPPPLLDDRFTRLEPTLTSFGWRLKASATAAIWLAGLFAASRFTATGRPLLVFLGVPYVVAATLLTKLTWRAHRAPGRPLR